MAGNEKVAPSKYKLLVAAIDFGTTYSGWAFSFHHDFKLDATKITCKRWYGGNHVSDKAPTAVLVNPDGETMEAFGYDAEDKYAQLLNEEEHEDYFFFQHFKMLLYNKKNLSRQLELEDITGKCLPAKRVFPMVIRYLKNDMLREVGKQLVTGDLAEDDIQWVLTVPAIWNVRAKQFMRECAVEAGIKSTNLLIALEPETASIYCKHFIMMQEKESRGEAKLISAFQPGARYLVLDAGVFCCPDGWLVHGESCYHFSHDREEWPGAYQMCSIMGGYLVEIQTATENSYLTDQVKSSGRTYWIGLSDVSEEGSWVWMKSKTKASAQFINWSPGEPSTYDANMEPENCANFYTNGFWNDAHCTQFNYYICEAENEGSAIVG